MIGFLSGVLAGRTLDGCFLDVGGVGYRLICSATTLRALPAQGKPCRLFTHLHVREDVLAVYGFATEEEQRLFESLIGVSGVGPKVAIVVCSAFPPEAFERAVTGGDVAAISSVPGIGKKIASRIVLELKDRLAVAGAGAGLNGDGALAEAHSALENLGYSAGEVRLVLSEIAAEGDAPVEDLVKLSLARLGRGSG